MKNIIKNLTLFTFYFLLTFYILFYKDIISFRIINISKTWLYNIVPILFLMILFSDLAKNLDNKFFYLITIIFGCPTNALLIDNNKDNTRYYATTKYSSLLFTYYMLSKIFNTYIAIYLIISNVISNVILILFIGLDKISVKKEKYSLNLSIKRTTDTLLSILGFLILFNIIPIYLINNSYIKLFLYSLLEITNSLNLIYISNVSIYFKVLFAIISLSTCGLCIELQIKSIVSDTSINYYKYFLYRLIHLIIFLIFGLLLCCYIKFK